MTSPSARFARTTVASLATFSVTLLLANEALLAQGAGCNGVPCPPVRIESPLYGGGASAPDQKRPATGAAPRDMKGWIVDQTLRRDRAPGDVLDLNRIQPPTSAGITMPSAGLANLSAAAANAIYTRAVESVLFVKAKGSDDRISSGSAVAVSTSAALTNCHVVMSGRGNKADSSFRYTDPKQVIGIETHSGRIGSAKLIAAHPDIDICVIQSIDFALKPVEDIMSFRAIQEGETVYSLGNPRGLTFSVAAGVVSAKRNALRLGHGVCSDIVQFTAAISPGSSGGALFNAYGQLIGIVQGFIQGDEPNDAQGLNLAIAADQLWRSYPDDPAQPGVPRRARLDACAQRE